MIDKRAELLAEIDSRLSVVCSVPDHEWRSIVAGGLAEGMLTVTARHAVTCLPGAVERELSALRAVVEWHCPDQPASSLPPVGCRTCERADWPCPTIVALYEAYCGLPLEAGT